MFKLKSIRAVLCLLLVLINISSTLIIKINFECNQEEITEQFCVNKNTINTNCHGKCYLLNQIDDNHSSEQIKAPLLSIEYQIPHQLNASPGTYVYEINYPFYQETYWEDISLPYFHPPC